MLQSIFLWLRNLFSIFVVSVVLLGIYATQIEPNWFEVVKVDLAIPELSPNFEEFKIVQN